jgi:hypothetical protein
MASAGRAIGGLNRPPVSRRSPQLTTWFPQRRCQDDVVATTTPFGCKPTGHLINTCTWSIRCRTFGALRPVRRATFSIALCRRDRSIPLRATCISGSFPRETRLEPKDLPSRDLSPLPVPVPEDQRRIWHPIAPGAAYAAEHEMPKYPTDHAGLETLPFDRCLQLLATVPIGPATAVGRPLRIWIRPSSVSGRQTPGRS